MRKYFLFFGITILLTSCAGKPRLHPSNFNIEGKRYAVIRIEKGYADKRFMIFGCDTDAARRKARTEGHPVVFQCSENIYVFYPDGSRKVYSTEKGFFQF